MVEVPHGTPLAWLTGATGDRPLLIGGYHGTWTRAGDPVLDRAALGAQGVGLGAGVIAVLGEDTCPLGEVARVARWLAAESAGQCGPCIFGLPAVADELARLWRGEPVGTLRLQRRLGQVSGRGACSHPTGATGFAASALSVFGDEVEAHERGGCGRPIRGVLPLPGGAR